MDHWKEEEENKDKELGIGGGYGQFGILSEEEFLRLLKTSGKRVQKFHEHPDEYKDQFYKIKYPKKDDGNRLVSGNDQNQGEDEEDAYDPLKAPKRLPGYQDEELDVFDIAKKRFNLDKEAEKAKIY